jgi:hypothetical protein
MTKHRKTRTIKRGQKGGFFGFGESSDSSVQQPQQSSWFSWLGSKTKESADKINTDIGSAMTSASDTAKSGLSYMVEGIGSLNPFSSSDKANVDAISSTGSDAFEANNANIAAVPSTGTVGGKRRKRYIKGGSNLAYYASPVSGLKVAGPTNWQYYANGTNQYSVKGGSRKRKGRKGCRTRRHRKR